MTDQPLSSAEFIAAKAQLIMKLRAKAIMEPHILAAIERVPREAFLPRALPIAYGQTISQPFVIARALVALAIEPRHRVLEIGTGTGYQACVMSYLARRVYSIERLRPLFVDAELRIKSLKITNVTLRHSDGMKGWPEAAPYDRIITACQSQEI